MSWIATDALTPTRDATRSLLLPFDRGRWLRLAFLALFVGGIGAPGGANFGGGTPDGGVNVPVDGGTLPDVGGGDALLGVALALVALAVLVGIAWSLVGAVMEFVLVTGLVDREIRVRRPFRTHLGRGLRLFAFRIAVVLVGVALVALPVVAAVLGGVGVSPAFLLLLVPLLALVALVALVGWLLTRLTTDFVVPTMLATDRGVLGAWRRLLPTMRDRWQEFALYVIVRFLLGIAAGIGVSLVVAVLALVVALPFLAVGAGVFLATATGGPGLAFWVLLGALVVLYVLAVVAVTAVVQAPVVVFFRYYALFVLGAVDADLDLVTHLRGDDGSDDGSAAAGDDDPDGPPTDTSNEGAR